MNNVYFENIDQVGKLYLEYVFYEFEYEPILFLCTDKNKNLYLCLCSEIRYEQKWIITKCNMDILKLLLNKEIDIASAFLISKEAIIVTMDLKGNEKNFKIPMSKIDPLDLPKEGTFIKGNEKALNYLLKKEIKKIQTQLKITIDISYNNVIIERENNSFYKINMSNKYIEMYQKMSALKKDEWLSKKQKNEKMKFKDAYTITKNEKYKEDINKIDIQELNKKNYLDAV